MTTQTEAKRLADLLERDPSEWGGLSLGWKAAAELRRLVSFNQQLMDEVARLNQAVAEEREACAKVCEELGMATNGMYERNHECAAAIRARGNT